MQEKARVKIYFNADVTNTWEHICNYNFDRNVHITEVEKTLNFRVTMQIH